jgi:hypothetical protein
VWVGSMAQTYFLYVNDRRYTVPTLAVIEAEDEDAARSVALSRLKASAFHESVEVIDGCNQRVTIVAD